MPHTQAHIAAAKATLLAAMSLLLAIATGAATRATQPDTATTALAQWHAGSQVSPEAVHSYGIDRCFVAQAVSDRVMQRMQGKSYAEGCTVARSDLRYVKVLHYTADGRIQLGELVCHRDISADLVSIFRQLFQARYPIERMVLIDDYDAQDEASMAANNTSCFCYRRVAGSKKLSAHSVGRAVDINTLYNPCVRKGRNGQLKVTPKAGARYADRTKKFDYKITAGDLCCRLFKQHGFRWGGDWRSVKDYQHFEKAAPAAKVKH